MRFVLVGALVVLISFVAAGVLRSGGGDASRRQRKELEAANRELREWGLSAYLAIQELRELAWRHRDIAPEFATIMIDEIAKREQTLRGKLPKGLT